ncbi:MAG: DUF4340 domain-containing protein [Phycisphaeraceae bacterium]|nr:DUF4340 domain-containing protein [Phycisphaeraceae bacterium]
MNFRTTLVLLVAVILLGTFMFWARTQPPLPEEMDQRASVVTNPLFSADKFPKDDVSRITLAQGNTTLVVEKSGAGDWIQTQPVRFPLNNWSAKQLGDDAAGLMYTETITPGQSGSPSLKDLELDQPVAVLTFEFTGKDKAKQVVKLGRKTIGGRGYLTINDDPKVYVVNDALHKLALDEKPTDWRKKSLGAVTEGETRRVVLDRPGLSVAMIKTDGVWAFDAPLSGRVSNAAVSSLLSAIGSIYIGGFIADQPANLAAYGLDKPAVTLTATLSVAASASKDEQAKSEDKPAETTKVKTLRLGAPVDLKAERYFATWSDGDQPGDVVFTISKTEFDKFQKQADDLRDARVTPIASADVTEVAIDRPAQPVKLLRTPDGWAFGDPKPAFAADHGQTAALVDALTSAAAKSYVPDAKPDGQPLATVTLTATGRPQPDHIRIYAHPGDDAHRLVLRNQETTGYLVATDKLVQVFEPILALRDRNLISFAADRVSKVQLTRPDGLAMTFQRDVPVATQPAATQPASTPAAWTLVGSDKFEQSALDELLAQFQPLIAAGWLDDHANIAEKAWKLVIHDADGHTLDLTVDPATRRATATGIDKAFLVSDAFLNKLSAEFRYRTVLDLTSTSIAEVTVTEGDQILSLSKDSSGQYVEAKEQQLDAVAVGGLFDTLAGLRADTFVAPVLLKDSEVGRMIQIATHDGRTLKLTLAVAENKDHDRLAGLGDRWFLLSQSDMDNLRKKLTKD